MKNSLFFAALILLLGCQNSASKDIAEAIKSAPPAPLQSANPAPPPSSPVAQGSIILALETVEGQPGGTTCLPMKVVNFQALLSTQYSLNWDPKVLKFNALKNFSVPGMGNQNFGIPLVDQGILTCVWIDQSLEGVTLPDGATLYEICFDVIGTPKEAIALVALTEQPTPFESVNLNEEVLVIQAINGGVRLVSK